MLTLLGPFLRKCYCFSGCTNIRVAFFFNPGMDQLPHLDAKKSASGSHRSDIWVRNISWLFWCKRIIILFLRTSYYNSLLVEQSMILNRRSDDGKKSRKFDFKTKHFRWAHSSNLFHLFFFSEMRGRPDEEEEPEKRPRRKISAWWDLKIA